MSDNEPVTARVLDFFGIEPHGKPYLTEWCMRTEFPDGSQWHGSFVGWDDMDTNDEFAKQVEQRRARFESDDYPVTITSRHIEVTDSFRVYLDNTDHFLRGADIIWEPVGG